jgi:hypothetical protein
VTEKEAVCYGVVSLLDGEHQAEVLRLWEELEREFGLKLRETHIPHFTYHSAERYDLERLEQMLGRRAAETAPFTARSMILGAIRAEDVPIFFLPLVRTRTLTELHEALWPELTAIATEIFQRYSPEVWMAAVALTPDLDRDISSELVRFLLDRDLAWEMRIDNLSLLRDTGTRQVLEYRLEFRGG